MIYKSEEIRTATMTQTEFGKLVGFSQARISQLLDEGILERDPLSKGGRLLLFDSLRSFYVSRQSDDEGVNFWQERALHERAKRETAELKLSKARGEVYDAEEVDSFLTELIIGTRTKLLGLGHKLALRLAGSTAGEICRLIDESIEEILEDMASDAKSARFGGSEVELAKSAATERVGVGGCESVSAERQS